MNGQIGEFRRTELRLSEEVIRERIMSFGGSADAADRVISQVNSKELWVSQEYQVLIHKNPSHGFGEETVLWHLSIRRLDRRPIHDWRDLQAIKNSLVGSQYEGFELYPSTSRTIDTANQYHLWVFVSCGDVKAPSFPVGFSDREVALIPGVAQRPFHASGETL